jgi:hypothetical protein
MFSPIPFLKSASSIGQFCRERGLLAVIGLAWLTPSYFGLKVLELVLKNGLLRGMPQSKEKMPHGYFGQFAWFRETLAT